jgi:hypothetical protein
LSTSRCFSYNLRYRDSTIHYTYEFMLFLLEMLLT